MKIAPLIVVPLFALTSCGGGAEEDPEAVAAETAPSLKDSVSSITKAVEITENNDPNNDIGRPGSYQAATVFYDSRTKCDDPAVVDVSCGAKIEVFENGEDAQARMDYIQELTDAAQGLIREYDYVSGETLLRVSGELKPSEAEEYEAAFTD